MAMDHYSMKTLIDARHQDFKREAQAQALAKQAEAGTGSDSGITQAAGIAAHVVQAFNNIAAALKSHLHPAPLSQPCPDAAS
jgi:hypothetical protein